MTSPAEHPKGAYYTHGDPVGDRSSFTSAYVFERDGWSKYEIEAARVAAGQLVRFRRYAGAPSEWPEPTPCDIADLYATNPETGWVDVHLSIRIMGGAELIADELERAGIVPRKASGKRQPQLRRPRHRIYPVLSESTAQRARDMSAAGATMRVICETLGITDYQLRLARRRFLLEMLMEESA